jgi:hypothetical protein
MQGFCTVPLHTNQKTQYLKYVQFGNKRLINAQNQLTNGTAKNKRKNPWRANAVGACGGGHGSGFSCADR